MNRPIGYDLDRTLPEKVTSEENPEVSPSDARLRRAPGDCTRRPCTPSAVSVAAAWKPPADEKDTAPQAGRYP